MGKQTIVAIHQPNYFPWLGYAHKMMCSDIFVLLDTVQFPRRNYVNRTHLCVRDEAKWLTVPVRGDYLDKINRIEIVNDMPWQHKHLKTIEMNYKKSVFFSDIMPEIEHILTKKWILLADLNVEICHMYKKLLSIDTQLISASKMDMEASHSSTRLLVEITKKLSGSSYLAGVSGHNYMETDLFDASGIKVIWQDFVYPEYPQVRPGMVRNLSAIDAFFNCGIEGTKQLLEEMKSSHEEGNPCC